jgi:putative ABC transport system permease protein
MANHLPMIVAVAAALGVLLGMILLLPAALLPLARTAAGTLGWLWGVEGRLAQGQVVRRRGRATLTIAVLFLTISCGVCLANSIVDSVRDVQRWGRVASQGDFFVRAMMPDMKIGLAGKMPPAVGKEIEAIKGIAEIQTVTFSNIKVKDLNTTILSGNFEDQGAGHFKFDLVSGDPQGVYAALKRGEVLIGTVLALRANLKIGDEIELESGKVRVAGTVNDYLTGGLTMYMDRDVARKLLGIEGVDVYVLWAQPGQHDAVEERLKRLTEEHGILLQTHQEVLGLIDSHMDGVVACLWSLLVVVFVVAAFGVVNTLTMNVIEQTRELGLLRIVAMTRRQVRKMILAQAAILALIGLAPGAIAGLGIAYVLNRSMAPTLGHPIAFVAHTSVIVGCFVTAFAIVLAAAWFPASRAARLKLAEAIQYQ